MPEGTVKFFNESKGFGFIVPDNGDPEIFVHVSSLSSPVKEKDKVSFEIENGKKGINAVKVKKI